MQFFNLFLENAHIPIHRLKIWTHAIVYLCYLLEDSVKKHGWNELWKGVKLLFLVYNNNHAPFIIFCRYKSNLMFQNSIDT
jgi:hypothetical protein